MQARPPGHDRELGRQPGWPRPGLQVTEPWTAGDHGDLHREIRLRDSWDRGLQDRRAEHGRDHVGPAATASSTRASPEHVDQPERHDGGAPDGDGHDHGPGLRWIAPASRGQRADQGARGRRGVQVSRGIAGPAVEHRSASAGNSARGMPNTMALTSMR